MNKSSLMTIMLSGALFVACESNDKMINEEKLTTITLNSHLPQHATTYGDSQELPFYKGGVSNVDASRYDLRFTYQIYEKGSDVLAYTKEDIVDKDFSSAESTLSVRLAAKEYDVLVWADFVEQGKVADLYYNTQSLKSVEIIESMLDGNISLDCRDAYCGKGSLDLTKGDDGKDGKTILLKRPFAKTCWIATDSVANEGNVRRPATTIITYSSNLPSAYNVYTSEIVKDKYLSKKEFSLTALCFKTEEHPLPFEGEFAEAYYLLGMDYIFASSSFTTIAYEVTIKDESESIVGKKDSNLPLKSNVLSVGHSSHFYSGEGSITATICEEFEELD